MDTINVAKLSRDLAKAAKIKSADDLNGELDRLKESFSVWFAEQTCWPAKEPQQSLAKIQTILHLPGALSRPDVVLHLLTMADIRPPVIARRDWPFPIQSSLSRIGLSGGTPDIHSYINLFESMLHLHFVVLASQFFWCFEQLESADDEELQQAVSAIYHILTSNTSGGGFIWAHWSAILSVGCRQLRKRGITLPFPELFDLLEPDQLSIHRKRTKYNTLSCEVASGGAVWDFCRFIVKIRNEMFHWESLSQQSMESIQKGLSLIVYTLGDLFKPYNRLMLAMVDERLPGKNSAPLQGIVCCWEGTELICATNDFGRDQLRQWWDRKPVEGADYLPAPMPPDNKYRWDESILLFDPKMPYERNLYLMPLGFRFGHAAAGKQSTPALPGLINTVRWQRSRVKAIVQRSYSGAMPSAGTITHSNELPDEEAARSASALDFIQRVIQGLKKYGFELPRQSISLTQQELLFEFDLGHHRHATGLLKNSVPRPGEIKRVLDSLHQCAEQKLLLEGVSGSGKSVLMAQIFEELAGQAVYLSFDCRIEPMEEVLVGEQERSVQTITVPVRMHYLAVLCKLTGTKPPLLIHNSGEVQSKMAALLKTISQEQSSSFYILIDGLNQTQEPTAPFSALPNPLPPNLFVLVATQPQEHVRKQVSSFGREDWAHLNLEAMLLDDARTLINRSWNPRAKKTIPDLPNDIIEKLYHSSIGIPIFLDFWGKRLRSLYNGNIEDLITKMNKDLALKASEIFPKDLALRFEEVTSNFTFQELPKAIFWVIILVARPLTIAEILQGIMALKDEADYPVNPVSAFDVEQCLSVLGGFLSSEEQPGEEARWRLGHEMLGRWFIERFGTPGARRVYRFSLAFLGARQLFKNSTQEDVQWWLDILLNDSVDDNKLPPLLLSETYEELSRLVDPKRSYEYLSILMELTLLYLSGTGEIAKGLAMQTSLEASARKFLGKESSAGVLITIGKIHESRKYFDQALHFYEKSLEICRQRADESPTPQTRRLHSISLGKIGDMHNKSRNDLDKALHFYEKSLEIFRQLADESPTPQARIDLCFGLVNSADIHASRNDLDKALHFYEESLEIRRQLVDESSTHNARRNVALSLTRICGILKSRNDLNQALQFSEESLEIFRQLADKFPTPLARKDVTTSLVLVGSIHASRNDLDKALHFYEESLEIGRQLVDESSTHEAWRGVTISLDRIGGILESRNDLDKALHFYEESLEIRRQLVDESSTHEARRDVTASLTLVGGILQSRHDLNQALHFHEESLEIRRQLVDESSTHEARRDVAASLIWVASILVSSDLDKALQFSEESLKIRRQLVDESPTPQARQDLENTLLFYKFVCSQMGRPDTTQLFKTHKK